MTRALHAVARAGFAAASCLLALALARLEPWFAEPPLAVRALPVVPWVLGFALAAALSGGPRAPGRSPSRLALALAIVAAALVAVVSVRGPGGLPAEVWSGGAIVASLPRGPVAVARGEVPVAPGSDWSLRWDGPLRAPQSGRYRLWVEGRGRVRIRLDGREVLDAEGERLEAGADLPIGRGEHRLSVEQERSGNGDLRAEGIRGHRLRLGWVRPRRNGAPGGRDELIPPRHLGPPGAAWLWAATDALAFVAAALLALLALAAPWAVPRRLRRPARLRLAEAAASLIGYAAVLCAMSWPLARDLAGLGVTDRLDGQLNTWILAWDVHALVHDPWRLFQAPMFHPAPDALAFSENLLLPALLAAPAILAGEPVLGYNLVFLLSALGSGLGVQLLVRRATGDGLAAFVAGVLFAAGSHRWVRIAHLHAHVTLFLPFVLLALDRFWERRSLGRGLAVGALLALQGLSSIYLGAITATVLAVAIGVAVLGGLRAGGLLRLAAGLLLAAACVAPVLAPYLRMRAFNGIEWALADVEPHATTLESYLAAGAPLYADFSHRHLDPDSHRRPLFPGLVPLALGIVGLASAPRRFRAVALAASAVAVTLSLGPETPAYRFLHEHVVLFRGIRALSRFSLVPVLSLCVLAGFALVGRRRLAAGALLLGLAEAAAVPLALGRYEPPPGVARWLAGRPGAVLWLPLGEREGEVLLAGLAHFRPLLNGYSGYAPRHYSWEAALLEAPDREEALRYLRAVGVSEVVAPWPLDLPEEARFGDERVFAVPPGAHAEPVAAGAAVPVLWDGRDAVLDLGASRQVGCLRFEPADALLRLPPAAVEVSDDGVRWARVEATLGWADATLSLARDPRHGLAELRFPPRTARFVRLAASGLRPGLVGYAP